MSTAADQADPVAQSTGREMVRLEGGTFTMGSDRHYPEEAPARAVEVDAFSIGRTTVTNADYAAFVDATGYVSVAERPLDPADFPGAPAENLAPGAMVFVGTPGPVDLRHLSQWWRWTPGACWRRPEGPESALEGREEHPVVCVATRTPSRTPGGPGCGCPPRRSGSTRHGAGWRQRRTPGVSDRRVRGSASPTTGTASSPGARSVGYGATAPVGSFRPNGYGLFEMTGNVWEWTQDWYAERRWSQTPACCMPRDPRGGTAEDSLDPAQPQFRVPRKVVKGGSFLCADTYCLRYRPAARRPQMVDTGMSHLGFRCASG